MKKLSFHEFVAWGFCAMLLAIFSWLGFEVRGTRVELVKIAQQVAVGAAQIVNQGQAVDDHEQRIRALERGE